MANKNYGVAITAEDRFSGAFDKLKASFLGVQTSANTLNSVLARLGVGLSVGAFATMVVNSIKAAAALDDLSESTGATVEQLSRFQQIGKVGGTSIQDIGSALEKLTRTMQGSNVETKNSAEAFAKLGINVRDARGNLRNSAEVFEEIAKKLDKYADGTNKTALMQAMLTKSGASLIPYMKDLVEFGGMGAAVMTSQAAEAEKLGKEINRLSLSLSNFGQSILLSLVGPLNDAISRIRTMISIVSEGAGGKSLFQIITEMARIAHDIENKQLVIGRITPLGGEQPKPQAPAMLGEDATKASIREQTEMERLAAQAREELAKSTKELTADYIKLAAGLDVAATEAKKFANEQQLIEFAFRQGLLTWDEAESLMAKLNATSAESRRELAERIELIKREEDALKADAAAQEQMRQAALDTIADMAHYADGLEVELKLLGLTNKEREKAIIDLKAEAAIKAQAGDANGIAAINAQRERAKAIVDQTEALKEQQTIWGDIERTAHDVFLDIAENGANAFKNIGAAIKRWVLDLLYQITIKRWIISISGAGAGGIAGSASAGGIGDLLSGASSLFGGGGNILSGIGAAFGFGAGAATPAFLGGADVLAAGGSALGLGMAGAASMAIPVVGLVLAAVMASGILDRKGGPKFGGFAQTEGTGITSPFFTESQANKDLQALVTGAGTSYANLVRAFGGTPDQLHFALGYDTDPEGTAQNRISAGADINGVRVMRERIAEEIGRDSGRLEEEIAGAVAEALKGALLASDIPEAVKALLGEFEGTAAEIEAYANKLAGVNALLSTSSVGLQQMLAGFDLERLEAFTDLLGGVGPAVEALSFYIENFYTEVERTTLGTETLTNAFASLGLTMPDLSAGADAARRTFRELVEAARAAGDDQLVADLLRLAPALDALIDPLEGIQAAVETVAETVAYVAPSIYAPLDDLREAAFAAADAFAIFAGSLNDWLGSLLLNRQLSTLSPQRMLEEARTQYLGALGSGDASRITGAANEYLGLAREFYGSSSGYNAIFDTVRQQVGGIAQGQTVTQILQDQVQVLIDVRDLLRRWQATAGNFTRDVGEEVAAAVTTTTLTLGRS